MVETIPAKMAHPLHLKENNFQKNNGKTGALRDESNAGPATREETGNPPLAGVGELCLIKVVCEPAPYSNSSF